MESQCLWCGIFVVLTLFGSTSLAQATRGGRSGSPDSAPQRTSSEAVDLRPALERVEALFREIDEQQLQQPPKRDLQVRMGEPQKTKLFRADPKLFENKFVSRLQFVSVRPFNPRFAPISRGDPRSRSDFPKEMMDRLALDNRFFASARSASQWMRLLADFCPEDQRPQAQLATLTSSDFDRDVQKGELTFMIYGPTAEEAKDRALAIVRLHDCGVIRPLQQYFLAEGRKRLEAARSKCDEYDQLTREMDGEREKLSQPSEVGSDILSQLKAQRVMVAVELAGLNARVKACDQMLNEPRRLEVSTLQSISDMKVKAEIERIGTQEKLDRINSFIAEGDRREAIQSNLQKLGSRRTAVRHQATIEINDAEMHIRLVEHYAPRELEGGAITISPVEWTE